MTQERIPNHILKKNYNYGFSLGLMKKDAGLALSIIENPVMFNNINSLLEKSVAKYGYNADYTEIAKLFFN
jgi:3-hydroxyisobutyrate dehydrogenase-like beta-hydroxyacid dehydrogenase